MNRCGVLAGAGQFGTAEQGIFSFWVHAHRAGRPLRYLGFGGSGHQVRDCLHPDDLVPLVVAQMDAGRNQARPPVVNVAGGVDNAMSLRQLTEWCDDRFGPREVAADGSDRPYDLPWVVLDATAAGEAWDWSPSRDLSSVLGENAEHAIAQPEWLDRSEL